MQTNESDVRVTDLANMYSMSKSTISTILQRKDLYKEAGPVVDDIVTIAETIGLRIDSGDVEELVEEHSEELSTEELQQFLAQQQRMAAEELSEEEGGRINNQCSKFPLLK